MRLILPIMAAIIAIGLLGYFHYEACVEQNSANRIGAFLTQSRACQLPGLIYDQIEV